jgi:ATP-dependent DNA helicase DinG
MGVGQAHEQTPTSSAADLRAALDELILPGTPQAVRAQYHSLAERAARTEFDLLEQDIVVLDTETTGLSFRDCELIQISAARISGREVVERYDTFVKPKGVIPPEITRLTGISAIDVADAPSAKEAVAGLAAFVGGEPVLAHNATFDRNFVERVAGGHDVSDTWVDTLALSRIALPRLRSHRLQDMAHAFGCDAVTHRATDDVDALTGMWRIILLALSDLPAGLLTQLCEMHPDVNWPFRPIIGYLARQQGTARFQLKATRARLLESVDARPKADPAEVAPLLSVSADEVRAAFAPGGTVASMYEHFEARPEQVDMACEVAEALSTSTHRAIEAGTGVGKSVAYLLPELLFAKRNDVTVGVATKTNALTDQLVAHELPALDAVVPGGVSFSSLKGYDHYPCLLRLDRAATGDLPLSSTERAGQSQNTAASEMLTAIAVTYAYACQSTDGDLDLLGIRWNFVPRALLTTTSAQCTRTRCPYFPNECFVFGARRRAAASDVVVTNHSLLLRDVEAEGHILPPIRHWVVDEAHGFEAEARKQWAREIAAEDVRLGFELLGGAKSGVIRQLLNEVGQLEDPALGTRLLTKLSAESGRAQVAFAAFFDEVAALGRRTRGDDGYDRATIWIDAALRETPAWKAVVEAGSETWRAVDAACKSAHDAVEALLSSSSRLGADLSESTRFLQDLRDDLRLMLAGDDASYVYSADLPTRKRDAGSERLRAEKLDIGADLAARWLPEMESVVFTSATMTVGSSFEHFDHAVGFDLVGREGHRDVKLASSFDFDRNMAVIVANDLPAPGEPGYIDQLVDLLFDVHVAMGGSVLTLFTNRRDMEEVFEALQPRLAAEGLELKCQERRSSPRRLRNDFIANKQQSLLALRSFWEGFDASGDTLRCVVVPKLPFANPHDPLVRERELREQRSWWRYSLPEAVLAVKQAAGRLIRSRSDTGVLLLADSRLVTKRYGRQFVDSMPSKSVQHLASANIGRYIETWRHSRS